MAKGSVGRPDNSPKRKRGHDLRIRNFIAVEHEVYLPLAGKLGSKHEVHKMLCGWWRYGLPRALRQRIAEISQAQAYLAASLRAEKGSESERVVREIIKLSEELGSLLNLRAPGEPPAQIVVMPKR